MQNDVIWHENDEFQAKRAAKHSKTFGARPENWRSLKVNEQAFRKIKTAAEVRLDALFLLFCTLVLLFFYCFCAKIRDFAGRERPPRGDRAD